MFLTTPGNFAIYPSFKLGKSISSTYTGRELLFKYEHFFFLKNGNLIINWVSLLFYKSLGLQKAQILNSLVIWEKSGNAAWAYIQLNFSSFSLIGKNWEVQLEQHSKIQKSFSWLGKTWKYNLRSTQKIPILNLWMTWEKVCPKFDCWK